MLIGFRSTTLALAVWNKLFIGIVTTVIGGVIVAVLAQPGGPFVHQNKPTPAPSDVIQVVNTTTAAAATPSRPAAFVYVSSNWAGTCTWDRGCPMTATFKNVGGPGNGSATFYVIELADNQVLAYCTTTIPYADAGESSTTGCTAGTSQLSQFIGNYPAGGSLPVRMYVKVN